MSPMPPAHSLPPGIATPGDYAAHASARLDDNAWAYLAGAAGDEITHHENRQAFDRLRLNPRVLADVTGGHTRVELFGRTHAHPILLAPVAYQRLFHPDGELASAQAAAAQGTTLVVSTLASHRLEDIAAAAAGGPPPWFQLYFQADRGHTRHLLARAEASGYQALVVTVDAPINGIRDREQRAGFHLPPHVAPVNLFGMTPPAPPPWRRGRAASCTSSWAMPPPGATCNPWHALQAHEPLGSINALRCLAYTDSAARRGIRDRETPP